MNIDEVYQFYSFLSNKVQSGNPTPTQFNISAERAQLEYYNTEYRKFQETREVTDAISPWIVPSVVSTNVAGQIPYPNDYKHVSALRALYWKGNTATPVPVREITNNDLGTILISQVAPPTAKYPVASYYNNYIQFYPKTLTLQFDYLIGPTPPKWAYTIVNGRPVYDPVNSIDFQALDGSQTTIVMMMLSYLGIYLTQPEIIGYAENLKKEQP